MIKKTFRSKSQKRLFESMAVIRVKLNPEQAVLSCCDSSTKVRDTASLQCHALVCTGETNLSSSS